MQFFSVYEQSMPCPGSHNLTCVTHLEIVRACTSTDRDLTGRVAFIQFVVEVHVQLLGREELTSSKGVMHLY